MHPILKTSSYLWRTHLLILLSLHNYWGGGGAAPPLATALTNQRKNRSFYDFNFFETFGSFAAFAVNEKDIILSVFLFVY